MPDSTEFGRLIDLGGRQAVRFARRYAVSRSELWNAITEPDRLARWAFRGEFEPRTGGRVSFDLGEAGALEGTIMEWDKPSVLEYEWAMDSETSWRVRFELSDTSDGGTLLTFYHLLPDAAQPEFAAGWHWHLDRLSIHLAGSEPPNVASDAHFDDLMKRYRADLGT